MAIEDLKLFSMLREKMHWHQTRQRVLAENIANADSPEYSAKDLAPIDFGSILKLNKQGGLQTALTNRGHLKGKAIFPDGSLVSTKVDGFEVTPSGNSVNLEEQMMKVTANQMDYQAVATLYSKGLGMIKTAVRKS
nr:flagellar basal body rod protein FlgB [uncultured Cohaesibacter sp.]